MLEQELMSLGILFFFAILGGIIAVRMKQPAVLGLLLVGALIGPNMFNLVKDQTIIDMMAEFGSILLLFVIGLEFVIPKLVKIGVKALMFATLKMGIIFFISYEVLLLFTGISQQAALIFGVMLSISSTVVIVKVLESKGLYAREEMPLLIGVLIMEDLFAVVVLTFLSGTKSGVSIFNLLENLIMSLTILIVAYLIILKLSKVVIPYLMKESSEEIVTFIALGICAGFSYLAYALGLQPATGAFLAGSIVASLSEAKLFEQAIKPYTLTFTSLFFISIGTMVNFTVIRENIFLLLVLMAIIIITRFIAVGTVSYLFASFKRQQMIFSSIAMLSVGEFSLLIAQAASKLSLGIDFVSIAAFLIFCTALIMSLSISYYEKVTEFIVTTPLSMNHKPRSFSNFIRSLTEELDTENTNSKDVKYLFMKTSLNILFLLFSFIVFQKTLPLLEGHQLSTLGLYAAFFTSIIVLLLLVYYNNKQVFRLLTRIITNLYNGSSDSKSKEILNNLLVSLVLLVITIFSPLLVVLFKLPQWINAVSFVLLLVMILKFRRLFNIVHNTSSKSIFFPRYKKVSEMKFNFDKSD